MLTPWHTPNLHTRLGWILPVRGRRHHVLQVARNGRPIHLRAARLSVGQQDWRVVKMVRADFLLDAQEATGNAIEKKAIVVRLVELAFGAA